MKLEDFLITQPPGFAENPFPFYKALRESSPIWWSDNGNRWLVTGYDEVSELLKSNKLIVETVVREFESAIPESQSLRNSQTNWISKNNEPDHSRMRRPFFEVTAVESLDRLNQFAKEEAHRLLLQAGEKEKFDALFEYAAPLTTSVIAEWFAIEASERREFRRQLHLTASHFSPLIPGFVAPAYTAAEVLLQMITRLFTQRRAEQSGGDFISLMAHAASDDVSEIEIIDNILLTLFASYETTLHLIGNGIYEMLNQPSALAAVSAEPNQMNIAVDEILRLYGPVQLVNRKVLENWHYKDTELKAGQIVTLILAAANRDPKAFANPDDFSLHRKERKHLSFGSGIHYCLGTQLTKQQTATALSAIFSQFPNLKLHGVPHFHPSTGIRGLLGLPVINLSTDSI